MSVGHNRGGYGGQRANGCNKLCLFVSVSSGICEVVTIKPTPVWPLAQTFPPRRGDTTTLNLHLVLSIET